MERERVRHSAGVTPQRRAAAEQALRALMPDVLADKIHSVASDMLGERRQATVLVWRIAGYDALTRTMDAESLYLLTDVVVGRMAEAIYEYEGIIDKHTGDGLMALFGLPVIHENDAERAVRAALDMCAAIEPLCREWKGRHGVELRARIGVHTGSVIAGQVTDDARVAYTVVGNTVSLADCLQSSAQPGTILVSFETYQCTRPWFAYQAVLPSVIGNTRHGVQAFRPLRALTRAAFAVCLGCRYP